MNRISIHNSLYEVSQKPELVERLGIDQLEFVKEGKTLPYAQKTTCAEQTGVPVLIVVLHGVGSVGHDNFLQLRMSEPLIRYCGERNLKTVILYPQCEKEFQWVDVPWSLTAHSLPEKPSVYMALTLALLDAKLREFSPEKLFGLGVSMGGYGIWDLACRSARPFDALGVMCGGADTAQAPRFRNTRIYMIHGAKDPAVPVCRSRDMAAALRSAGCRDVVYEELPEAGHNVWDPFFQSTAGLDHMFRRTS